MDGWRIGQWKRRGQLWLLCLLAALVLAPVTFSRAAEARLALPKTVRHLPQVEALHQRALQGEAAAQALLGDYCYSVADYTNAVVWYQKAAAQGDVGAKLSMACCYKLGRGVEMNLATAEQWYRQTLLPQETSPRRPEPAPSTPTPISSSKPAETRAVPPSMKSGQAQEDIPPPSATADRVEVTLASPPACSKRITALQPPKPMLLDMPLPHQPYR